MGTIKSIIQIILLLTILSILVIFSYSNIGQDVQIFFDLRYFGLGKWGSKMMPLPFALFISFIAGVIFVSVITIYEMLKYHLRTASLQKEIKRLKKELSALRNYPIEEGEGGEEVVLPERGEKGKEHEELSEEELERRLKEDGMEFP